MFGGMFSRISGGGRNLGADPYSQLVVKNTFFEVPDTDAECPGRTVQSFPPQLPSAKEAADKAAAWMQEKVEGEEEEEQAAREQPKEEAARILLADATPAVPPFVAAAPGPPTVQGVAPDMAPFGGGAYPLGTGQGYDGSWLPWGQPPMGVQQPLVVDHGPVSYAHDFQGSFGLPAQEELLDDQVVESVVDGVLRKDQCEGRDPYENLDGTNEMTSAEDHTILQKLYKDRFKKLNSQAESLRKWVKRLEEELERRNKGACAPASCSARGPGGGGAVGGPLPLIRALSGPVSAPAVPPPPPPRLQDTKAFSEPHKFLREGEPAYIDIKSALLDGDEKPGPYSCPPFTKWGEQPPSKIEDFGRGGYGGAQTPETASVPASLPPSATTSSSSTIAGGSIFGGLFDTGAQQRQPCDLGPGHNDDPESCDMLGWARSAAPPLLQAPPATPPPPAPAPAPADAPETPSPPAPVEVSPEEADEQYTFTVHASKLSLKDKSIVSKPFSVLIDEVAVPFLVQITASKIEDKKGGHNFKKAKGHGKVEVNCKKPPANGVLTSMSFVVGSQTRGPVHHNFAESSLCGLAKEEEEWDFLSAVDQATSTVTICVKIPGHKVVSSS